MGMKQSVNFDFSWVCFRMRPLLVYRYFVSGIWVIEGCCLSSRGVPGIGFVLDNDVGVICLSLFSPVLFSCLIFL